MRIPLLLITITVAACGKVKTGAPDHPPDAGLIDDAPSQCPIHIAEPAPPSWLEPGVFTPATDPAGGHAQVWVSGSAVPSVASFSLPFKVGDRITGLMFDAYGSGASEGLRNIYVLYEPPGGQNFENLGMGEDVGRNAKWGQVVLDHIQPTGISGGELWLQFTVTEQGYYIGMVTPILERPCP